MTLAKKNSRTITVNGRRYRWKCFQSSRSIPQPSVVGDSSLGRVNLTIEDDECDSSQIRLSEIQRLVSHYRPERSYTPQLVRRLIEHAIASGWTADGADFEIEDPSILIQD